MQVNQPAFESKLCVNSPRSVEIRVYSRPSAAVKSGGDLPAPLPTDGTACTGERRPDQPLHLRGTSLSVQRPGAAFSGRARASASPGRKSQTKCSNLCARVTESPQQSPNQGPACWQGQNSPVSGVWGHCLEGVGAHLPPGPERARSRGAAGRRAWTWPGGSESGTAGKLPAGKATTEGRKAC